MCTLSMYTFSGDEFHSGERVCGERTLNKSIGISVCCVVKFGVGGEVENVSRKILCLLISKYKHLQLSSIVIITDYSKDRR